MKLSKHRIAVGLACVLASFLLAGGIYFTIVSNSQPDGAYEKREFQAAQSDEGRGHLGILSSLARGVQHGFDNLMSGAITGVVELLAAVADGVAETPEFTQYHMRSNVVGASMVTLTNLSRTTQIPNTDTECAEAMQQPVTSPGSRVAANLGWLVLQEAKVGKLDAILISRGIDCPNWNLKRPIDPNIAFFDGSRLVGVLYPKGKDDDAIDLVAIAVQDEKLKIIGAGVSGPVQGRVSTKDGITYTFDAEKGEDAACSGKYRVPVTTGKSYGSVRQLYINDGWLPTQQPRDDEQWVEYQDIYPELSGCIPTGTGECFLVLKAKDGPALLHITGSDWSDPADKSGPLVYNYEVMCDGNPS